MARKTKTTRVNHRKSARSSIGDAANGHGVFRPEEMLIFRYHNGEREIEADPLALHCALMETPDFVADMKLSILQSEAAAVESAKAFKRLVTTIRKVFGLADFKSVDGVRTGLTDAAARLVLYNFGEFIDQLKKKAGILPTSATPSPEPSPTVDSPTINSADSTSTATAFSVDEPIPSLSESESPCPAEPLVGSGSL